MCELNSISNEILISEILNNINNIIIIETNKSFTTI